MLVSQAVLEERKSQGERFREEERIGLMGLIGPIGLIENTSDWPSLTAVKF